MSTSRTRPRSAPIDAANSPDTVLLVVCVSCLFLVLATGCSSRPPPTSIPGTVSERPPAVTLSPTATPPLRGSKGIARRIVNEARSLLGTPYRYGGESRRGLDCSGLTSTLFANLGVPLPRTAQQQATAGHWVAPDELRPGDLAFFGDERDKLYHVGLVVSSPGQPLTIVHSTESRGVVETNVTASKYWLSRFEFGRRILPE